MFRYMCVRMCKHVQLCACVCEREREGETEDRRQRETEGGGEHSPLTDHRIP